MYDPPLSERKESGEEGDQKCLCSPVTNKGGQFWMISLLLGSPWVRRGLEMWCLPGVPSAVSFCSSVIVTITPGCIVLLSGCAGHTINPQLHGSFGRRRGSSNQKKKYLRMLEARKERKANLSVTVHFTCRGSSDGKSISPKVITYRLQSIEHAGERKATCITHRIRGFTLSLELFSVTAAAATLTKP